METLYKIDNIKEIGYDGKEGSFYILANTYKEQFGIHLVKFDERNPHRYEWIMNMNNSLEIDDCDIQVIECD